MPRSTILMISIGNREWAPHAFETFQHVARRWGVDAHLITEDDAEDLILGDLNEGHVPTKRNT